MDFILAFDGSGRFQEFVGGYSDYRRSEAESVVTAKVDAAPSPASTSVTAGPRGGAEKKLSYNERKEYSGILDEIAALETEKSGLEDVFSRSAQDPVALESASRRYSTVLALIEARTIRWEELAERDMG